MADLVGNLLIAQSGGPTVVMNASLAGIIQEAGKHEQIEEIYGALHGISGILNEDLIDLNEEKNKTIEGLRHTPGAALGTCRHQLSPQPPPEMAEPDKNRLLEVLAAHNIRHLLFIGGGGSAGTASQIHDLAKERNYELRIVVVPKAVHNDLPHSDHSPGYGSVLKYNATTILEIAADLASLGRTESGCCVVEVLGQTTGWVAAGTVLAKRSPTDAPHLILLPEVPFDAELFLARVNQTVGQLGSCLVVVGEGLKIKEGNALPAAQQIASLIQERLKIPSRSVQLGYAQRAAAHAASGIDLIEAVACGEAAVRAAVEGKSGVMIKLVRTQDNPYQSATDLQDLKDILDTPHAIPRDWLSEDGLLPNEKFIEFARPLIAGEVPVPFEDGLPKYATLEKHPVEKKLPPTASAPQPPAG